jgi:hypothetical protein
MAPGGTKEMTWRNIVVGAMSVVMVLVWLLRLTLEPSPPRPGRAQIGVLDAVKDFAGRSPLRPTFAKLLLSRPSPPTVLPAPAPQRATCLEVPGA